MRKQENKFQRIALGVAYDGSFCHGFQYQKTAKGVANYLYEASRVISADVGPITCAGRTDAGVHAVEQVIHMDVPTGIDIKAWTHGMNRQLPLYVRVLWAQIMDDDFHARFSAVARRYRYLIYTQAFQPVHLYNRAYHAYLDLDIDRLNAASQMLLGEHDFSGFQASGCQAHHPNRCLQELSWQRKGPWVIATIKANAFLYKMVRNLMGALLPIGYGKKPIDTAYQRLIHPKNNLPAQTAPPYALYLDRIYYDRYTIPRVEPWYENLVE